ncbi:hypothetical protein BBI17_004986 [Phytophthora kernoviae]|uniref:Uncharacterized protein n=1 Tax=Phytophthora kernoviae TaxID=325452 RepID=A0A3R7FX88_9STRA|nr:hypothetical protein BBI17_004986 [Phytophthora kernoviae]
MKNGYAAIQPAGAFLQQAKKQETRRLSNPIAVVGSCTDIDEALRLRPDLEVDMEPNLTCQKSKEFEPESFLTAMRRGTSTASSSAPTSAWNQQEKDLEEENQEDLIFQLDM